METQGDLLIREAVEAMSREMDFYKELKRRRQAMSTCVPKTELTQQQQIAFQNSTCEPLLKQVAKSILEEIEFNRNERRWGRYLLYVFLVIIFIAVAITAGFIIWEFNKPPKRRYGLKS